MVNTKNEQLSGRHDGLWRCHMRGIFLIFVLCVSFFSACSSTENNNDNDSAASESMSESNEKYCVTIHNIEADQHNVIVHFSVESLEGEAISSFIPAIEVSMNPDGRTQFQSLQDGPEAADHPEENVVHHSIFIRRLTQATEFALTIKTLQDFANEKEYPVDITIKTESLEQCEQLEIPNHGPYTGMTLSPLGLWIWDAAIRGLELKDSMPQHDIYLVFQDGTRLGYSAAEYAEQFLAGEDLSWTADQVPYKEQTYISILFQNKIDIHEVTAIEIDGEVIGLRE